MKLNSFLKCCGALSVKKYVFSESYFPGDTDEKYFAK